MTTTTHRPVLRSEYRVPDYWIDRADLVFRLDERRTRVRSKLAVRRNCDVNPGGRPLVLHGEDLMLEEISLNGRPLAIGEFDLGDGTLSIVDVPDECEVEIEVEIDPQGNTQLSGLYLSDGVFCTQCEAEGFRRITYFLDRPDVMARYRVRIEAPRDRCPVMLSNGNRLEQGTLGDGMHFVQWEDPFPKPSYLFALVAGDLRCHRGTFTTRSGREVQLEIWVEPQNIDRCEHALRSLQDAMKWDEDRFGLEYDLDVYMVVAVNAFNMGAMENKGLNIFNSKYVLANPETATDADYEAIQGVIGHEYFHNWTGNRVTCRDWFQLTLKEGLTVFRDQEFSADMTSAAVKRIADVRALRTHQFTEDAGPLAHPIRPESYVSMDNFYTVTVYEKGAEVVRMYQTLLGREGFRRGMDLYFERHDGTAVTCDDFRAAMADANGRDLSQFERWYSQAGTPVVRAKGEYDSVQRTYRLTLSQRSPRIGGVDPKPLHIPVRLGLLGPDGRDLSLRLEGEPAGAADTTRVLELTEGEQTFRFVDVPVQPVPSLLRGFSAPVRLEMDLDRRDLAFLMAHDSDAFRRWDAGFELATNLLLEGVEAHRRGRSLELDPLFVEAVGSILSDPSLDGSSKALALTLPDEIYLGQQMEEIDPDAVHTVREFVQRELGRRLLDDWRRTFEELRGDGPYEASKAAIDRRRLKGRALAYLVHSGAAFASELALRQFQEADNMTDREAALACLCLRPGKARDEALERFFERYRRDPLVLDKWFRLQATAPAADTFERVLSLREHPAFRRDNPNRVRSLVGAFASGNPAAFHREDGEGYRFLVEEVLAVDRLNPQIAARLATPFNSWRRYESGRRERMRQALEQIAGEDTLSKDTREIVERALAEESSPS